MDAQYDGDSNGFEQECVSETSVESESDSDVKSKDYTDNSEAENSEEESHLAVISPVSFDQPLSVPPLKIVTQRMRKSVKKVPVRTMSKTGNNEVDASKNTTMNTLPKKRPYVETDAESSSSKRTSAPKEKLVSICKDPVEQEVNRAVPIDTSRKKPKVSVKKSRKPVAEAPDRPSVEKKRQDVEKQLQKDSPLLAVEEPKVSVKNKSGKPAAKVTDKPPVEKGRQDVKKRSRKVSAPRTTIEIPSTALNQEKQVTHVTALPQVNVPRKNETSTKRTKKISSMQNLMSVDHDFWSKQLASNFESESYRNEMIKNGFTEKQTDFLQRTIHKVCHKINDFSMFTDRFMKTHKCIDCEYALSHQCLSPDLTQGVRCSPRVLGVDYVAPATVTWCYDCCAFGFVHSHNRGRRVRVSDNLDSLRVARMIEEKHSLHMKCPRCYMNIVLSNRNGDVCSDFTSWVCEARPIYKQFFDFVASKSPHAVFGEPYFSEFYTCYRRCCAMFHRCPMNSIPTITMHSQKA